MTIYHTYLSDSTESGLETIKGIQNDGSEFGVGISSDIVCNNISAGIITATQISGTIIGFSTLSAGYATAAGIATYATAAGIATYATAAGIATYASTAGIATYATTAGISTYASTAGIATYATTAGVSTSVIGGIASVTQLNVTGVSTLGVTSTTNLTSQQLNVSGIVTAATYVATGTTSFYSGGVGISTVDSDTTAFHYISYDTNLSGVNISNFGPGKKFEIIARQTTGNNRTIVIKTSTTTTGHVAVPMIVNSNGNITNGTFTLNNNGIHLTVFNMNGTVIGGY